MHGGGTQQPFGLQPDVRQICSWRAVVRYWMVAVTCGTVCATYSAAAESAAAPAPPPPCPFAVQGVATLEAETAVAAVGVGAGGKLLAAGCADGKVLVSD